MKSYKLSHVSDRDLLRRLEEAVARDRATTAELIALISEVDARRLYLPKGYASMYMYCVRELHLSESAAYKRIQAARAAREVPEVISAIASGRLHPTAVVRLAPHLSRDNAAELIAEAEHKTTAEVELLLARRFPCPDMPAKLEPIGQPPRTQLVSRPVGATPESPTQLVSRPVQNETERQTVGIQGPMTLGSGSPAQTQSAYPKIAPLAPERFALQITIGNEAHEDLQYLKELLGHRIPTGDLEQVLTYALRVAVEHLEKRKLSATSKPASQRRASRNSRHVPANVKRQVWKRDGGQCAYVAENGQRCNSRTRLEFDHMEPVARGGRATCRNIRLLCRAHNQHVAECEFGEGFMRLKRDSATGGHLGA